MHAKRGARAYGRDHDRRQRRLVQALVATNVVAVAVLVAITLRGSDETGEDSAVPVAAAGAPVAEPLEPEPAADAASGPAAAPAEPATAPAPPAPVPVPEEETAPEAQGQGDVAAPAAPPAAAAPRAAPDLPRLDVTLPPPAGFEPVEGGTLLRSAGPFDLAVQFDPLHPVFPRSRLDELGLQATGNAAWQSPTDTLVVTAYEFPDPQAAAAFVDEAAAPWQSEPEVMPHDLHGVTDSRAFHQMGRGDHSQFALAARGTRAWVVGLTGASAADHDMELIHQTLHALGA